MKTLLRVFSKPYYVALGTVVSLLMLSLLLVLPNIPLLVKIAVLPQTTVSDVVVLAWKLMGSIMTNFSLWGAFYAILLSALFGTNVSLVVYYLRMRESMAKTKTVATSGVAFVAGLLGIGCASCGSIIAASVLSILGFGGVISLLPFGGAEFGVLGLTMLLASTVLIVDRIKRPFVC